ncbi:hypothetical protein ABQD95_20640 [Enterococcus avium]|uniref:hypothetical protein n=1 Tax=Enterococcus avium TaxID=33945 RepID=UPI0032E4237F
MNKQEKEQFISFINEAKEDLSFDFGEYHRTHRGYVLGTKVIGYIKHLYEQQKVKARLAKHWDEDLGDCLWWDFPVEEPPYCGTPLDDDFPKYKTHFTELHIPDEVEEEPKWVVKVGNLYFCGWEDTTAQFVMNTVLGEDESIIKYKNEGTASSVAKNLGGTAEKA